MSDSPAAILFDSKAVELAVTASAAIPANTRGLLAAGVDATGSIHFATFVQDSIKITGSVGLTTSISSATATTGSAGLAVGNAPYQPLFVSVTSSLPVTVQGAVTVTEGSQVSVDNFPAVQAVSGTVTADVTTTGSAGLAVGNAPYAPLYVSVTSSLPVTVQGTVTVTEGSQVSVDNFPATQAVSGTVTANVTTTGSVGLLIAAPAYAPVNITGSVGLNPTPVITANTATTGTAGLAVGNAPYQPLFISVTSSLPVTVQGTVTVTEGSQVSVNNFPAVQAVSGTVTVTATGSWHVTLDNSEISVSNFPATQSVSGTVGAVIENWPAVVAVSGSQLTGSTFSGFPVVAGGVSGSTVKALQTDVSGAVYVTTTGSLPVVVVGTVTVTEGSQVSINNFPATQSVSGTVGVNNFPAVLAVSGSQLTGSTFSGFPVVLGGVSGSAVKALQTDVSGAVYVTATGSLGVAAPTYAPLYITSSGSIAVAPGTGVTFPVSIASQLSIDNFPATQAVSGTVGAVIDNWPSTIGVSSSFPLSVWSAGTVGVSGTVTANVTTTGSIGLLVAAPAYAPVNITGSVGLTTAVTANTATTGSAGLAVGNAPYQPLYVSVTSSLPVTFGSLPQLSIDNFPSVQAVSGSQLTGSTFSGFPVVAGGVDVNGIVRGRLLDAGGATMISTTGSQGLLVSISPGADRQVSGQIITASLGVLNAPAASFIAINSQAAATIGLYLSGTWTGNINFEGTVNGVDWFATYGVPGIGAVVTGSTTDGFWAIACAGINQIRAHATTWTTNSTASVILEASVPSQNSIVVNNPPTLPVYVTGSVGLSSVLSVTGTISVTDVVTVTGSISGAIAVIPVAIQTANITVVSSSTSAVTILAKNPNRVQAVVYNDSPFSLYVGFSSNASAQNGFTYCLNGQTTLELPVPAYTGVMSGYWLVASGSAKVTEITL